MKENADFRRKMDDLDEKEIIELFRKSTFCYPYDLSKVEEEIENTEPISLTDESQELFLATMRNTIALRAMLERKWADPNTVTSFGELIFLYREKMRLSNEEFSSRLDLNPMVLRSIEEDRDSKMRQNMEIYKYLVKITNITHRIAIKLILNSFKISAIKERRGFTRSYSRDNKNISEDIKAWKDKEVDNKTLLRFFEKEKTKKDLNMISEIKTMLVSEID